MSKKLVQKAKAPTFRELETIWYQKQADFVAEAHTRLMHDDWARLYAYIRPSSVGQWGELLIAAEGDELPSDCQLITGEPIPPTDRQGITRWLARFAGKLPVFPL